MPNSLRLKLFPELIGIIMGFMQVIFSYLQDNKLDSFDFVVSVFWFTLGYIVTSFFITSELFKELSLGFKGIDKRLSDINMVEHCGKATEARSRLFSALASATEVYNVYINTIDNPAPAGFDRNDPAIIRDLYTKMLNNRAVNWQDIIGGNTARYKERFAGMTLPATPHANFHCHELAHAYPSVNFTVFGQHGMPKEVMFGFGLHDAEQNGDVFWSRDPRVVGYFESLFKAMQDMAIPVTIGELIQP